GGAPGKVPGGGVRPRRLGAVTTDRVAEVELGAAALDYMRRSFAEGRTLSHLLLVRTDLDGGRLFTCVPPEARARVDDFTGMLVRPTRAPEYDFHGDPIWTEKPTMI